MRVIFCIFLSNTRQDKMLVWSVLSPLKYNHVDNLQSISHTLACFILLLIVGGILDGSALEEERRWKQSEGVAMARVTGSSACTTSTWMRTINLIINIMSFQLTRVSIDQNHHNRRSRHMTVTLKNLSQLSCTSSLIMR